MLAGPRRHVQPWRDTIQSNQTPCGGGGGAGEGGGGREAGEGSALIIF